MDYPDDPAPDICLLEHHVFTRLEQVTFRRSLADGTPVMVVPLGDCEASVSLRALQREFAIDDATPDGRMLGLIADSLDYVVGLQLGDRLPSEVLTGRASWEPQPRHRQLAAGRLRLQLLAWLDPDALGDSAAEPDMAARLDEDPRLRSRVQAAFEQAAESLGLPGPGDVVTLMAALAEELAYIEAMREQLFRRVQLLAVRLERMVQGWHGVSRRQEMLTQVHRLTVIARQRIGARFEDIDAGTGEVLAALREAESQQAFIRGHRDWLYRCYRAWEPILDEWDRAGPEAMAGLIARTYQFLAPRYMPVMEWQAFNATAQSRTTKQPESVMQW